MRMVNIILALWLACLVSCSRSVPRTSGNLPQRGYVWQRDWTPAVIDSVLQASKALNGIVVLGGEVEWQGQQPHFSAATIDWEVLRSHRISCALALRVAPYDGPFAAEDGNGGFIVSTTKSLLSAAATHGVNINEFQLDFDCATKNLAGYKLWLRAIRKAVHPIPFVVTTLPAWLDDPEFVPLAREADRYVLQVHSVPVLQSSGRGTLCDVASARRWVNKAAGLKLSFSVALPTYRCTVGYGPSGKLLSVGMDSVQPAWPPNTRILEFEASPDEMAMLIEEWRRERVPELTEVIWYRIPVASDIRNWGWITLSTVMSGRRPVHELVAMQEGSNPIDISIQNAGERDEQLEGSLVATWTGSAVLAGDGLRGWSVDITEQRAVFRTNNEYPTRLPPGKKRTIGWLRYDAPTALRLQLTMNK
jgi:uncharacterized protein DUF3142